MTKPTKLDKARIIIAALWKMDRLPDENNRARWNDVKRLSRSNAVYLEDQHQRALTIIKARTIT